MFFSGRRFIAGAALVGVLCLASYFAWHAASSGTLSGKDEMVPVASGTEARHPLQATEPIQASNPSRSNAAQVAVGKSPGRQDEAGPKKLTVKELETLMKKPLARVKKIAADFEIKRAAYRQVERPDGSTLVQVTISPPTPAEVAAYRSAVAEEMRALPEQARPFLMVDAQRWQDQVLNVATKPRVIYYERYVEGGRFERQRFIEMETDSPASFGIDAAGAIVAQGSAELGPWIKWLDSSYSPPAHLTHLVKVVSE